MDAYFAQSQVQGLQQVLAPQLRQSLEMLQVPVMELRTLIAQELQLNPTLEELTPDMEQIEIEPERDSTLDDVSEREFDEEFEVLARLDEDLRDSFRQNNIISRPSSDDDARRQFMLESITESKTLQEHLMDQLAMSDLTGVDRQIAEMMIGSINSNGYLSTPLEELAESTGVDLQALESILAVIQDFDPIGVGSQTLEECLLKQIERLQMLHLPVATIVQRFLPEIAGHKYADIARQLRMTPGDVQEIAHFIGTLEPHPGRAFETEATAYVLPEVFVFWKDGKWTVTTNDEQLPQLRISNHYKTLMRTEGTTREVKSYIRDRIRAGSFLMKSINQRQSTIRNIAENIVKVQEAFLEKGVRHLKPLTMSEVADKVGIHETTVSRAIANKYMETPQGTFEMKYFFTPGFKTADGNSVSNKSIKDAIQELIANEDTSKPLSDQAMVRELTERGLKVARRTIAKYRDELKILPSHLRKLL